jgi:hypothetical protein
LGKMMPPGGELTALACHPTKTVNKAKELAYLFTKLGRVASTTKRQSLKVLTFIRL